MDPPEYNNANFSESNRASTKYRLPPPGLRRGSRTSAQVAPEILVLDRIGDPAHPQAFLRAKAAAGDSDRHTNLDGSGSASQTLGSYGPSSCGQAVERQSSELSFRRGRRTLTCTCHYRLASSLLDS